MIWRTSLFVFLIAAGSLLAVLTIDYRRFVITPVTLPAERITLDIPKGTSLRSLARRMTDQGILRHPWYFVALAYLQGDQVRIKAGEFELTANMTPPRVLQRITSGQVIEYSIVLVEGWTFRQALATIDAHPQFGGDALARLTDQALMSQLGRTGEHPEGRFFPDTYRFPGTTKGLDVLRRALERMDRVLAEEWQTRRPDLPIGTPYEALILASIIEKETAVPAERPQIGGVFVRRLQKGMRLQTDPTVIYGLGERYDGNLRRADLREANPYNTYAINGLPPTPIALPGRESIRAALQPQDGDSLYFVARGDGSHEFSGTLEAHNRAVRRYILGKP
ncbi:endolytic transglycosylase MltG [uncultured Thiocystis sp.]|uniref:endolytic transglycosylase MltG n=1 Tax=uncultured Thiocystis sp. TaxID=1202134 RepID=UPI0025E7AE48|nr:endolytic transglycosylase MltG [uncultured Thiocystis sp.]